MDRDAFGDVTLSRSVNGRPIRHAFGKQDVFRQRDGFRLGAVALAILDAPFCVRLYPQLGQTLLANSLSPYFWSKWMESVAGMQSIWMKADQHEAAEITEARSVLLDASSAPRTIVLVIGESTTRDDWSLYGYSRDTTPKLKALESKDSNLGTFRQAWSVDASTIAAFRSMFTFPVPQSAGDGRINLFALFSAAGWTVHWISNQDDIAIQTQYAVFASETQFINRMTGRSSASMDLNVLPTFKQALADPAPRKLIVVHLIGAHPHYALRFRDSDEIDWGHDHVMQNLNHLDRSPWVVAARNQYDWAMRYQDEVLSELFHLSKMLRPQTSPR